ncbi:MAG: AMP-binding protein, partial [Anaerolineae bacterium]
LKTGAALVLVPPSIEPSEVVRQIKDGEPTVLITLTTWAGLARRIQEEAGIPYVVLTSPYAYLAWARRLAATLQRQPVDRPDWIDWDHWLAGQPDKSPNTEVDPSDLAVVQYTAGTTRPPRGVMLSHRNLVANAMQTRHWMPNAVEGRERFLSVAPLCHSYGMTTAMNAPIALGAAIVLKPKFETLDVLKAIRRYRPTIFAGVPSMYVALSNFRGVRKYGIASVKTCMSGSEPLPVEVQEAFEKLTRGRLVEGYGLTEASPVTHANPLGSGSKPGTIGMPVPSTEATIFDLQRRSTRAKLGQIGELAVRGPQVMLGYWKDPGGTAEVLREDGWLLTGDIAQQDEDGYFRLVARKADMWYPTRPGKPAFPRDIEEVIYEVPQVREVAVVGIASQPFAFVIATSERPTAESIIAYCQRRLPPALVPRLVIFTDDFPRTFIGKVLRRELARRFEQRSMP